MTTIVGSARCDRSECYGLSTDEKPTNLGNASVFMEMDTGKVFLYDKENNQWWEV